jgi:hypothetical protein
VHVQPLVLVNCHMLAGVGIQTCTHGQEIWVGMKAGAQGARKENGRRRQRREAGRPGAQQQNSEQSGQEEKALAAEVEEAAWHPPQAKRVPSFVGCRLPDCCGRDAAATIYAGWRF